VKLSSFWPPRRSIDRAGAEIYRRRNLDQPWLTRQAIRLLPDVLKPSDHLLEWGAGGSTAWLGRRVGSIVSVEHDPHWHGRVQGQLEQAGLDREAVRLLSPAPVDDPARSPYVRVIDEFGDGTLNVCIIDGEHRASCALACLPKLSGGGLLVLDDGAAYLDHATASPHSRQGRGPLDADWARFGAAVSSWKLIWTSDGYSDTALWIKPGG